VLRDVRWSEVMEQGGRQGIRRATIWADSKRNLRVDYLCKKAGGR